ncbi:MAG: hypothetical protein JRL30_20430 [Deltaproteobacteria bacterium]|nr:hypothetical protein [Deltaproteobacteria bacterium]
MKIDAHYYAVLAFARAIGFNKDSACQIAYASQFVDDAKINLMYLKEDPGAEVKHDVFDGQHLFLNMATCHSYTRVKTFNYGAMINNTCAFHFVPGCEGTRFSEKLRCKEDSEIANNILKKALEQADPIKLGIVLHTYADTFSHQDFSGLLSKVNDIQKCKAISDLPLDWRDMAYKIGSFVVKLVKKDMMDRLLDKGLPAYGHGQAAWFPDLPYLTWAYTYDPSNKFSFVLEGKPEIVNPMRFERAFKKIKTHLETFLEKHPQFRDPGMDFEAFDVLFTALTEKMHTRNRIKNWKNLMVTQGFFEEKELFEKTDDSRDYHEDRWLKEAFVNFDRKRFHQRTVKDVELADHFLDSNWYKYYLAVAWYKEELFDNCRKFGLDVPR